MPLLARPVRLRGPARPAAGTTRLPFTWLLACLALTASACRSRTQLARGDAAVVVSATPAGAPGDKLAEKEPNGSLGAPMPVDLVSGAATVAGTLADEDEEDRFLVEVPAGPAAPAAPGVAPSSAAEVGPPPAPSRQLAIEVTPAEGLATSLAVEDVAGGSRGRSTAGPGQAHGLPNVALSPGDRAVVVVRRTGKRTPAGPGSAYQLALRLTDKEAADETEPNDSAPQATLLGPAHTAPEAAGFLGGREDIDWFRVPTGEIAETTVLTVELEPPPGVIATITVFDQAMTRLSGGKSRKGQRLTLHQIAPPAPPAFLVSIKAEGAGDREHRYTLRVRSEDGPPGEREPNDDPAHATPVGEGPATGYLGLGDVDLYRIDGRKAQTLSVTVSPPRKADLVLEALLPGDARWMRADAARRGGAETLALTPAADGAVFLRISGKRDLEPEEESYRMTVDPSVAPQAGPGTNPGTTPGAPR
jgi:hypothetical protein